MIKPPGRRERETNHRRREAVQPTSHTTTRPASTNQLSCLGAMVSSNMISRKQRQQLTVSLAVQDFRGQILGSPAKGVRHIRILHVQLAQSEIAKCDMSGIIEKDVLRFQIAARGNALAPLWMEYFPLTGTRRQDRGGAPEPITTLRCKTSTSPH